jgi:hypothetical protein
MSLCAYWIASYFFADCFLIGPGALSELGEEVTGMRAAFQAAADQHAAQAATLELVGGWMGGWLGASGCIHAPFTGYKSGGRGGGLVEILPLEPN